MSKHIRAIFCCIAMATAIAACSEKDGDADEPASGNNTLIPGSMADRLAGTVWTIQASRQYDDMGFYTDKLDSHPECRGHSIGFSTDSYWMGYKLYWSRYSDKFMVWGESEEPGADVFVSTGNDAVAAGEFTAVFGTGRLSATINGDVLTLRNETLNTEYVYRRGGSVNNGGGSGGGSPSDDAVEPEVELYDYTQQGSSAVKVDYIIYNKDEAGVTSAQIKYGQSSSASSSASTSLSGQHVTATIRGLKANQDYYVKCTVRSKSGTTTTPATRIRLSEW